MKVCFETFGCRLNRAEALDQEAKFLANGWEKTKEHGDADLIIVRGCSVTARAQRDCMKFIDRLRTGYPAKRVFTTGCLTDKTPDAMIENALSGTPVASIRGADALPTSTARAYLKIQDGCNGACSFCIVPKFRGKSVSEDFDAVLSRAKRFLDCGYTELVLTGCNLSLYLSGGNRLADLLAALADLSGAAHRVRLGSLEPGPAAAETVRVMAEKKNICKFLHIPVQSASNRILTEMRRPYKLPELDRLVADAVRTIPDLGLGCDIITGFPGETDSDFVATAEFLKRHPFSNIHAFPYSERPGTPAARMTTAVDMTTRSLRAHELSAIVKEKRRIFAKRFRGRKVEIVIEDASNLSGWTSQYLWCTSRLQGRNQPVGRNGSNRNLSRKSLVEMTVKDTRGDILFADPA